MGTIEKMKKGYEEDHDLFSGDPAYEEEMAKAKKREDIEKARAFLGVKDLDSCSNCKWNLDGECNVMKAFNQDIVFTTWDLQKCKHWKKEEEEN